MKRDRCPWPWCECPHTVCVAGWIDGGVDESGNTTTAACELCRPEVARHLTLPNRGIRATNVEEARREYADMRRRLREQLPHLSRPSRTGA